MLDPFVEDLLDVESVSVLVGWESLERLPMSFNFLNGFLRNDMLTTARVSWVSGYLGIAWGKKRRGRGCRRQESVSVMFMASGSALQVAD